MIKYLKYSFSFMTVLLILLLNTSPSVLAATDNNTMKNSVLNNEPNSDDSEYIQKLKADIKDTSDNASLDQTIQKARDFSLPALVVSFFIAAIILIFSKKIAFNFILTCGVAYIFINYTETVLGFFVATIDGIMSIFSK